MAAGDVWGNSWGNSWGTSWAQAQAPATVPDITSGVEFDGTNDYLTRGENLTGSAHGNVGTFSFWIKTEAKGFVVFQDNFGLFNVTVTADGFVKFLLHEPPESAASGVVDLAGSTDIADGEWHHVIAAWDVAADAADLYLDDALEATDSPLSGFDVAQEPTDWAVGAATNGDSKATACLGELYWAQSYLGSLSTEANRRKFYSSEGFPVSLGSDGSTPTGAQPVMYLSGGADQFADNVGSGGAFTVNGALEDCPLPAAEPEPEPESTKPDGAPGKRRKAAKYPRRIVIEGRVYTVKSAEEERELLRQWQERVEAQAVQLALAGASKQAIARAKVKVVRVARRIEEVDNREAEWIARLMDEDEEILLLLH